MKASFTHPTVAGTELVTKEHPSLPHQAGKAYLRFMSILTSPPTRTHVTTPFGRRSSKTLLYCVNANALIRPDIDFDRLGRILVHIINEREYTKLPTEDQKDRRPRGRS